jgi:hypothetical protein
VDAVKGTKTAAFDHEKMAEGLSKATGRSYKASMLPFQSINFSLDGKASYLTADRKQWRYDLQSGVVSTDTVINNAMQSGQGGFRGMGLEVMSPDRTKAVYIKDWNLWVRDVKTNESKQLTTDGIKDFGYATDNAGWNSSDRPVLRWSPDSKK